MKKYIVLFVFLFFPHVASAAIALVDSCEASAAGGSGTVSCDVDISGDNTIVVVFAHVLESAITSITVGGNASTAIGTAQNPTSQDWTYGAYRLGETGTVTVQANRSDTDNGFQVMALVYSGVDQDNPIENSDTFIATTANLDVALETTVDTWLVAGYRNSSSGTASSVTGGTERLNGVGNTVADSDGEYVSEEPLVFIGDNAPTAAVSAALTAEGGGEPDPEPEPDNTAVPENVHFYGILLFLIAMIIPMWFFKKR